MTFFGDGGGPFLGAPIPAIPTVPSAANGILPGTLIATQQWAPAGASTYTPSGSLAAVDTTNLTLAFTVPASGNVDIGVSITGALSETAAPSSLHLGLLNHTGGAQLGNTIMICQSEAGLTVFDIFRVRFHLTGLAVGALQVDLASNYVSGTGSAAHLYAQGATGAGTNSTVGPALIQAFAA